MPHDSPPHNNGARKRLDPIQHAGEVKRSKKTTEKDGAGQESPAFQARKIGGAKDLLGSNSQVTDSVRRDSDWRNIEGVKIEDASLRQDKDKVKEHPLAAPPAASVSDASKESFLANILRRAQHSQTQTSVVTGAKKLKRNVFTPFLTKSSLTRILDNIASPVLRNITRKRIASLGTSYKILTSITNKYNRLPRHANINHNIAPRRPKNYIDWNTSVGPTYSEAGARYERKVEEDYHLQCIRKEKRKEGGHLLYTYPRVTYLISPSAPEDDSDSLWERIFSSGGHVWQQRIAQIDCSTSDTTPQQIRLTPMFDPKEVKQTHNRELPKAEPLSNRRSKYKLQQEMRIRKPTYGLVNVEDVACKFERYAWKYVVKEAGSNETSRLPKWRLLPIKSSLNAYEE